MEGGSAMYTTALLIEEQIELLAEYFVKHEILRRYNMSFDSFLMRWQRGIIELE